MKEPHKIKVMIIDDHDSVRKSLNLMLETFDDFEVVASTDDARAAITLCAVSQPDVVLMDLMMPKMDGVTATRLLRSKFPHVEVIALTSSVEGETIKDALDAGVIGYILKSGSIDELMNAIRDAYVGKHNLVAEAVNVLLDVDDQSPPNDYQ